MITFHVACTRKLVFCIRPLILELWKDVGFGLDNINFGTRTDYIYCFIDFFTLIFFFRNEITFTEDQCILCLRENRKKTLNDTWYKIWNRQNNCFKIVRTQQNCFIIMCFVSVHIFFGVVNLLPIIDIKGGFFITIN